jgi:hypothetical protein
LKVRKRKRDNLPVDSIYCNAKYDTAFIAKMSDDEDEYKDGEKTGLFVTRPPSYRSKEVRRVKS